MESLLSGTGFPCAVLEGSVPVPPLNASPGREKDRLILTYERMVDKSACWFINFNGIFLSSH